jgi:hypothetical protein
MPQFFHGLHTHQTCTDSVSVFGMLWMDSMLQFPQLRTAIEEYGNIPQSTA